ncbi:acyl carrier protein [Nocardia anaemiae]|uniref:acyl carrier protein n=1 Tax=Nocardia anaemiae TaxID=263910 RepID=UPI0009FC6718|nr:acyl carrier protein [Nocardia anaemiae]
MGPDLPDGQGVVSSDLRTVANGVSNTGLRAALLGAATAAIADLLNIDAAMVSTNAPFSDLGLSSLQLARLTAHLEDAVGVEVSLTALYDHPDIEQLVEYLAMR